MRTKLLTSNTYSPTNPASEAAIRQQIDDSIQEVYDASAKPADTVNLVGNQSVAGIKTFVSSPIVPTPTTDLQASTKKYVDDGLLANKNEDHLGTWQGLEPVMADPGISGIVSKHTNQIDGLSINAKYPPFPYVAALGNDMTDDTVALNGLITYIASLTNGGTLYIPPGTYKHTSALIASPKVRIVGGGKYLTLLKGYNCDGIVINPEFGTTIKDISIYSVDAVGTWYPKTHTGIKCNGTGVSPLAVNRCNFDNIDLKGHLYSIDLAYTWSTTLSKIETLNCKHAVRLLGQSVNNSIDSSSLIVDNVTDSSSLLLEADALNGEGLMITNTILASGKYGIKGTYFLSLHLDNCIVDQVVDNAFNFTGCLGVCITNCWAYSQGDVLRAEDLGVSEYEYGKVSNSTLISVNGTKGIYIGALVEGWKFENNDITSNNLSIETASNSKRCIFTNNQFNSVLSPVTNIQIGGSNHNLSNNVGYFKAVDSGTNNIMIGNEGFYQEEDWITPTLLNSWVNFGGNYGNVEYSKDKFGIVHLRGSVKSGVIGSPIFTLPAGFRPLSINQVSVSSNSFFGALEVGLNGNVNCYVGSNVQVSLSGISFRAEL